MFGAAADAAASKRMIAVARDNGVNFIDTADTYVGGESERIVGGAIKGDRDRWILATKAGNDIDGVDGSGELSRRWLSKAIDGSLTRLGLDYVDVYYCHIDDGDTPLEESIAALCDIIAQSKVRWFAISNFRAWRHAEVVRVCDDLGVPRPIASQPYYNAFIACPKSRSFRPAPTMTWRWCPTARWRAAC